MSSWVGSSILKAHSLLIPLLYFNIDLVNFLPSEGRGKERDHKSRHGRERIKNAVLLS